MKQISLLAITLGCMSALMGCTVDPDVRCNFGETPCPETFYCGGEWCYPRGAGPGPLDMTSAPDMSTDAAPPDMAPDPDMAVDAAPPDMAVDAAPPDMAVDAALPDMAIDAALPDMAVDAALPDMAADAALPDMGPTPPTFRLVRVDPQDRVLSSAEGRRDLTAILSTVDLDGIVPVTVSFIPADPDGLPGTPEDCLAVPGEPDELRFVERSAAYSISVEALRQHPSPARICIVAQQPGGSIVSINTRIDDEGPILRVDPFETGRDRASGVIPVVVISDDVAAEDVGIFGDRGCVGEVDLNVAVEIERDDPARVLFRFSQLEVERRYTVFIRAVDAADNVTCVERTFTVDPPPTVERTAFFCEQGLEAALDLEIDDDGVDPLAVAVLDATCNNVNLDEEALELDLNCDQDCTIRLLVSDVVGPTTTVISVNAFDPNAPRFRTPLALSYVPGERTASGPVASAVHTVRDGIDTLIVSGRDGISSRMTQWQQTANGWESSSPVSLAGKMVAGHLVDRDEPSMFVANIGFAEPNYFSAGCSGVLLPDAPYSLAQARPIDRPMCSVQEGNFVSRLNMGLLDDDVFADVVSIDNTGRVDLWRGGRLALRPVINLHPGDAADAAILPGTGRVAIAHGAPVGPALGARVIDADGNVALLQADDEVACVAAVDWLGNGVSDLALCVPGGLMIHFWDGDAFVEPQFVRVDLGGATLVDVLFERADHPQPTALLLDSEGRVGVLDASGVTLWDLPEPMRRIIDLQPEAQGIDAGLVGRDSGRLTWMLSDTQAGRRVSQPIANPMAFPQTARAVAAGDLTGDYVDDIVFIPVAGGPVEIGDGRGGVWREHRVFAENVLDDRLFAIGDFNADGRPDPAAVRRLENDSQVLRVGVTGPPDANRRVGFPREVLISIANAPAPWGLAVGPLDPESPGDLIAVGVGTELRIYQIDFANEDLVRPLGLVTTIRNVTPAAEMVIADVNGTPGVVLFNRAPGSFSFETWSLRGASLGQGESAGDLQGIKTATVGGKRRAYFNTQHADDTFELREITATVTGNPVVFNAGEIEAVDFAIGDVDGDQVADLVIAVSSQDIAAGPSVRTYDRTADGRFVERDNDVITMPPDGNVDAVFIGDFDGDRRPDRAVVYNPVAQDRTLFIVGRPANE